MTPRFRTGAAALALLALAACRDAGTPPTTGTLSLLLTDAPGDFVRAVVTIERVTLQAAAGDSTAGGRIVLRDAAITTDLLTLANSTADLVRDVVVPAGRYAELRFEISGGYVEVANADGSTSLYASSPTYAGLPAGAVVAGDLQMPSFAPSGLKVTLPGEELTLGGEAKVLLVDFDVARSFGRQAGQSGRWVMHPVLEATEVAATGTLTTRVTKPDSVTLPSVGTAALTLAQLEAVLTTTSGSRETLPLADPDGDGAFEARFRYLAPGSYQLAVRAPMDSTLRLTTAPAAPVTASVASGAAVVTPIVITAAGR